MIIPTVIQNCFKVLDLFQCLLDNCFLYLNSNFMKEISYLSPNLSPRKYELHVHSRNIKVGNKSFGHLHTYRIYYLKRLSKLKNKISKHKKFYEKMVRSSMKIQFMSLFWIWFATQYSSLTVIFSEESLFASTYWLPITL